ncbi:translocation/assembly module TamB [bacterium]|nr:translocation/assembly module TamB [bacterium]MBU1957507.1 translocation/assembly module TamB [bacterium]
MIRFFYWLLAIIEVILLLAALLLFIITDARTIKVVADNFLPSTKFSYEKIEGNFFTGLEIKDLAYKKKALFNTATVHWNPLTLLYKKITFTEVDIQGVEVENIIEMIHDLESKSSDDGASLDFSYSLDRIHLDINPYVYEGVKFSSFLFETEKIEVDEALNINTKALYLYFDSDLVNVELVGKIDTSRLLLEKANLKEISSREINRFIQVLRAKKKITQKATQKKEKLLVEEEKREPVLKEIKIKEILATLKTVNYDPVEIKNAKLLIVDAEFDTYNNYVYKAKDLNFTGKTNFGSLEYKGDINNSMIDAQGALLLDKELFDRYKLPLNYKNLRKLPSTLKLNDEEVWLDIHHDVKDLLQIKSTFNLDVTKGEHTLHYDYSDQILDIESVLNITMPYGENVRLENKTIVDEIGHTSYEGTVVLPKITNLTKEVSDYLLEGLKGEFKGDSSNLVVDIDSKLLTGSFVTHGYENATMNLKSKEKNIELKKMLPSIMGTLEKEMFDLESESFFDFKNGQNSKIDLQLNSTLITLNAYMKPRAPYKIVLKGKVPSNSSLLKIDKKIKIDQFSNISGEILIEKNNYWIQVKNQHDVAMRLRYDVLNKAIKDGLLLIGEEEIRFEDENNQSIKIESNINNLQNFLSSVQKYYEIELPNIQGNADLNLIHYANGLMEFKIQTPQLKYVDANSSALNFNNVDALFTIDKNYTIEIKRYRFELDNKDYLRDFYSNQSSYLLLKDGKIIIKELWLKDQAVFKGEYDFVNSKGDIKVVSEKFSLKNKDFDLLFRLALELEIRGKLIDIEGDISILGNQITYDIAGSSITEDADIIIVQEMLKNKKSALQNLKLYLKIKSEKPLKYLGKDTQIEFFNELRVLKNYKTNMMVTGMSTITKGHYQMEDKRFVLNESHLYFAGDPRKPLLDIKANYEKDQYTIHIFISGSAEEPIVNFNSDPYLTQQEILSLILFDGTGSSSGQGAEAYTLLGGTFAKGLIKSLGVDVDHLLLGTDTNDELSLEIGRKISDNITMMYLHEDGKDGAKVRIEHSKDFETDIIIQPPSTSSIEFLYKQDR